jgi:hypothetical protein
MRLEATLSLSLDCHFQNRFLPLMGTATAREKHRTLGNKQQIITVGLS